MKPEPISIDTLRRKYAAPGELDADAVRRRVARTLAAGERDPGHWERVFLETQEAGFIPAGRINAAAGTGLRATLINCFVQPVGDSIGGQENGCPGIYPALLQAAETLRRGGGVGYDFSRLRPKGALVRSTRSLASGPVSYMRLFDRSCETLESAGARRGAQMGVLRADHPDIERFIAAKDQPGELSNFNLSVAADDGFMTAVTEGREVDLVHQAEPGPELKAAGAYPRRDGLWVYRRVAAGALLDTLTERAYLHGDPGVLFLDSIARENNLGYCETIRATNPCGEQPLPSYGCCCLGSFDLTRFVRRPFESDAQFDLDDFASRVPAAVRMLDQVLDITDWPLPEQAAEARQKRRIGLGFTGLGDALILLGLNYDSDHARAAAAAIARTLRDAAYWASVELAGEKGSFPLFDRERYGESRFIRRLPADLRQAIQARGIRNSHLISIAPAGTISLAFADNASNGIEPAYAWTYGRRVRRGECAVRYQVRDPVFRRYRARFGEETALPPVFVSALEIGVEGHLGMVAAVAPYVDAGISKTVNLPANYPFDRFRDIYLRAWRLGLKGLTTFRSTDIRPGVLSAGPPETALESEPGSGARCTRCESRS
ncbi:MAG: ribonucleotide reductase [Chromatiaceae bacterium]|nr:ribonucleotide reductase [Chromatiaceae bacterium]